MKLKRFIVLCAAASILLVGCKKEITFDEPTIEVYKDGTICQTVVETFDKPYYDEAELKAEYDDAIDKFNSSNDGKEKVSLNDLHVADGNVYVSVEYESYKAASDFQSVQIFYGTVEDALKAGYAFGATLKGIEDGNMIEKAGLKALEKNHVLITGESGMVDVPKSIVYVSANVEVVSDNKARVSSDSSGLAYIVTK